MSPITKIAITIVLLTAIGIGGFLYYTYLMTRHTSGTALSHGHANSGVSTSSPIYKDGLDGDMAAADAQVNLLDTQGQLSDRTLGDHPLPTQVQTETQAKSSAQAQAVSRTRTKSK